MFKLLRASWSRIRHAGFALLFTLLFLPVMAHGPGTWESEPLPPQALALVGKHFVGDGMGYNLELDLKADGRYYVEWQGCMGIYGTARGRWHLDGDAWEIQFAPEMENGTMEGHLTTLQVMDAGGDWVMVQPERIPTLKEFGVDDWIVFQRVEILEKKWAAGMSAQSDED